MYILSGIKRAAVCAFVILLISGMIISPENENSVTGSAAPESSSSADEKENDYKKQLEDIERRQKELDKLIADADDSIEGEKQKLAAAAQKAQSIKEQIAATEEYSAAIEDEMASLDEKMRETMYALSQQEEDIKQGVNGFMGRIRAMYVAGTSSTYTDILINSDNFYDVLMRLELVKSVAAHDKEEIDRLIEGKNALEKTKAQLEEESEALKEKSKSYGEQQLALAQEQKELLALQIEYGDKITQLESEMDTYVSISQQLDAEFDKVSSQANTTTTTTTTTSKTTTTKKSLSDKDKTSAATTSKKVTSSDAQTVTTPTQTTPPTSVSDNAPQSSENTEPTQTTVPDTAEQPDETSVSATAQPAQTEPPQAEIPTPDSPDSAKADIVVAYAKSMVGGSYVWGGSDFGATDCSGLVMQSYAQVGISLPHKASLQAAYGKDVSYSEMQPGDCIFFGDSSYSSVYHVAIYIGNGRMVHAENTYTGIVISNVDSFSRYNHITCIKRIL